MNRSNVEEKLFIANSLNESVIPILLQIRFVTDCPQKNVRLLKSKEGGEKQSLLHVFIMTVDSDKPNKCIFLSRTYIFYINKLKKEIHA